VPDIALFAQVLDPANRADPYRLYAHLRETPILRDEDGTYIVSTYAEIRSLLQDSRVSSEDIPVFKRARTGNPILDFIINPIKDRIIEAHRPLLFRDPPSRRPAPPDHDPVHHGSGCGRRAAASMRSSRISSARCVAARKSISLATSPIPCRLR